MGHHDGERPGFRLRRRRILQGLGGAVGAAAIGCGSDVAVNGAAAGGSGQGGDSGPTGAGGFGGSGSGGQGGEGGTPITGCEDRGGLSPEELLAPIDTIVVLCMENRSFDHYLGGSLGLVEGRADIDGLTGQETNPHPQDGDIPVYAMDNLEPESPPHGWDAVHDAWNQGAMDRFVEAFLDAPGSDAGYADVMGYYVRDQVPIHHALADAYVACNAYFSAVLGPTWPNRFFLHGATSNGMMSNQPVGGFNPIWEPLKDLGLTVKNYHHGVAWCTGGYVKLDDLANYSQFQADAAAGTLPNFSIIDPQFFLGGANDDHPTNANVPLAQLLISDVYTTLSQSPQWNRSLLVVTYDEHGGFYDHVPPPVSGDSSPDFDRMGCRVPALVAGPYVREGCALNTSLNHPSILKTLSTRWGVGSLNARMTAANDLAGCIDPGRVQAMLPREPVDLPPLSINMRVLRDHFEAVRRGRIEPQHPEILQALRDHGIYRTVMRSFDGERVLKEQLDRAVRKGIARLT